ncbi:Zinc finger BED domain-containing protein 5 [Trichinella sp. T9]|nr:Zinc finger BED domain-containing protein 5 [Trichinella sp. T9]
MCLIERSRRSLSRRAQYASALCRSLGMDEWLIRNPVKREIAEMEFQKGSTADPRPLCVICYEILADESMRPNKLLRHTETKQMDLKSKPLQFLKANYPFTCHCFHMVAQRMDAADIFSVHDKKIRDGNYCCFETLATFIVKKEATPDEDLISMIVSHLDSLKESFDYYFCEEVKFCDKNIWIVNPFQCDVVATGISTKADEELIDLSEDYSFKMSFDRKRLIQIGYQYKTHIQLFPPQH